MPNIKLINIRFNLDLDDRDIRIYEALFQHPDGARNKIIKDALYHYLLEDKSADRAARSAELYLKKTTDKKTTSTCEPQPGDWLESTSSHCIPAQQDEMRGKSEKVMITESAIKAESETSQPKEDQNLIAGLRSLIL